MAMQAYRHKLSENINTSQATIDAIRKWNINQPVFSYLTFCLCHTIHHRGQMSTYLRPMGSKVPGIYGPSADEEWKPGN